MGALSADRNTPSRTGLQFEPGVKGTKKIYAGSLVALSAGFATPAAALQGLVVLGRAEEQVDNTNGNDGDVTVKVTSGVFRYANSAAGDEITAAEIGKDCFVVDDQTVAKTDGGAARPRAGVVIDVDAQGVWIAVGPHIPQRRAFIDLQVVDLVSANAKVYRAVSPVSGVITKIRSVLDLGALATGDATLTGKIGATAITNGVITITQAGSAAGDVDVATPTAANLVAAGDVISFTVGGTNTGNTAQAHIVVEIAY
jgi:hypothetical protein